MKVLKQIGFGVGQSLVAWGLGLGDVDRSESYGVSGGMG